MKAPPADTPPNPPSPPTTLVCRQESEAYGDRTLMESSEDLFIQEGDSNLWFSGPTAGCLILIQRVRPPTWCNMARLLYPYFHRHNNNNNNSSRSSSSNKLMEIPSARGHKRSLRLFFQKGGINIKGLQAPNPSLKTNSS